MRRLLLRARLSRWTVATSHKTRVELPARAIHNKLIYLLGTRKRHAMTQFKVVITDFGSPENELEANELRNSGLDIELVRLNAKTPQELLPHVADSDGLIVQWTN